MPLYHAKTNKRIREGDVIKDKFGEDRVISRISEGTWFGGGIYLSGCGSRFLPSELGLFVSSTDKEVWNESDTI